VLATFRLDWLVEAEMLDFGYRRWAVALAPIALHEAEVTSHSGRPKLPETVISPRTVAFYGSGTESG
jgi:hypothetical protein